MSFWDSRDSLILFFTRGLILPAPSERRIIALDPEFYMKTGARPGTVVGTMDAVEINYAANYLADLVRENNLPPKILIVHRYTYKMLTTPLC